MIAKTKATAAAALLPEVLAYTSSLAHDLNLVREDLAGSLAHLAMLEAVALVPSEDAKAIRTELAAIAAEATAGKLALAEEEDVHMAIEARLTDKLGERAGSLHTARSRNDQIALDLSLFVRETAKLVLGELALTLDALTARAKADAEVILPAYTHRQRAMPITAGYLWASYGAMLARDVEAFEFVLAQANVLPLGVGAIAGTSLPIDREHVKTSLAFARVSTNGMDTVGNRDFELDLAFASARLMNHVGRIASDLIDYSSSEFGFVKLGDAIACGSSMMPQKKNPDLFELLRGKSARATGNVMTMLSLAAKMPSGYGRDLQEDRESTFEAKTTVIGALTMLRLGLEHVAFDRAKCLVAVENDYMQATDLAEAMVATHRIPFRTAYRAVGALVKLAQENKTPLSKVTLAQAQSIDPRLDAKVLEAADAKTSAQRKTSAGGTGAASIAAQLVTLEEVAAKALTTSAAIPSIDVLLDGLIAKGA